jgi:hypothetical protein
MSQEMNVVKRLRGKTPRFFKRVIQIAIGIGAVGATIIAAPIAVPAILITAAKIMITVSATATAISKLTIDNSVPEPTDEPKSI